MKIYTKGEAKFNCLRRIIRCAQNDLKDFEYNRDIKVSKAAAELWEDLEELFKQLGPYVPEKQ